MAGPRYVRLDVDYFANPKIVGLSPAAVLLHLACICWCGAQLTDGHIPAAAMVRLRRTTSSRTRHLDELLDRHLLYQVDDDYLVHDYTAMQDSRATVERRRRQKAERMAAWRAGHGL